MGGKRTSSQYLILPAYEYCGYYISNDKKQQEDVVCHSKFGRIEDGEQNQANCTHEREHHGDDGKNLFDPCLIRC